MNQTMSITLIVLALTGTTQAQLDREPNFRTYVEALSNQQLPEELKAAPAGAPRLALGLDAMAQTGRPDAVAAAGALAEVLARHGVDLPAALLREGPEAQEVPLCPGCIERDRRIAELENRLAGGTAPHREQIRLTRIGQFLVETCEVGRDPRKEALYLPAALRIEFLESIASEYPSALVRVEAAELLMQMTAASVHYPFEDRCPPDRAAKAARAALANAGHLEEKLRLTHDRAVALHHLAFPTSEFFHRYLWTVAGSLEQPTLDGLAEFAGPFWGVGSAADGSVAGETRPALGRLATALEQLVETQVPQILRNERARREVEPVVREYFDAVNREDKEAVQQLMMEQAGKGLLEPLRDYVAGRGKQGIQHIELFSVDGGRYEAPNVVRVTASLRITWQDGAVHQDAHGVTLTKQGENWRVGLR
jgi:hypothetical protein